MILSVTLSKPTNKVQEILERPYIRAKIKLNSSSTGNSYFGEFFTQTQAFHKTFSESDLENFLKLTVGSAFKNCVKRTETEEITLLTNNKGEVKEFIKKNPIAIKQYSEPKTSFNKSISNNRQKNYILKEGERIPFLMSLGIMTDDGRVIASKFDKFKQINRYLEYIDDILDDVLNMIAKETDSEKPMRPLRVVDFGSGKSYLTFATHYFLTEIKHIPCSIVGLDLKEDVIDYCNTIAKKFNTEGLVFKTGNILDYGYDTPPDIVITLHACDTATDYALEYAVKAQAKAILSVPCCQHEVNKMFEENKKSNVSMPEEFAPLLKYGLIRERFASLVTDSLRAEKLEQLGYSVQVLEFIDMTHTPKNLLIRAIKNSKKNNLLPLNKYTEKKIPLLESKLNIAPMLSKLI